MKATEQICEKGLLCTRYGYILKKKFHLCIFLKKIIFIEYGLYMYTPYTLSLSLLNRRNSFTHLRFGRNGI